MQDTDGFFDFDNASHHSPLEPEPHGDGHAQNGRQELQSPRHQHHHELSNLAREVDDKMRFGSPAHVHQHQHHQLPPADPAIVNVMRFPPVPLMPPFLPPGAHPMAPPPFPPGIMHQAPNFPGPMPHGLHDPAIMSMGQIPPNLLLLQQQQQLQRQLNPMMNQPPPQQQQNKPGGIRTVEEIERQLLSDQHQNELRQQQQQQQARFHHHQQQQQQHQFQQQQQQARFQQHQQQQRHNHYGQNYGNTGNCDLLFLVLPKKIYNEYFI